jgi:hypothetical protein
VPKRGARPQLWWQHQLLPCPAYGSTLLSLPRQITIEILIPFLRLVEFEGFDMLKKVTSKVAICASGDSCSSISFFY